MDRYAVTLAAGLFVVGGPAFAADLSADQTPPSSHPISGYVELRGGWDGGSESGTFDPGFGYNQSFNGYTFGGAGRVAVGLSPTMSLQADAWDEAFGGRTTGNDFPGPYHYSYNYTYNYPGIGGHLSWRAMGGDLIGVLASVGASDTYGTFGNIGIEGVHNAGNWRFYGQAGFTGAIAGNAASDSARDWYVHGVVGYYFTPNFVLSGNLGYDGWNDDSSGGTTSSSTTWGARLEYKPASIPVSGFLAYWGHSYNGSDHSPSSWSGTENAVVAGLRILFDSSGTTTLRQIDDSAGLSDMNQVYGEGFPH